MAPRGWTTVDNSDAYQAVADGERPTTQAVATATARVTRGAREAYG